MFNMVKKLLRTDDSVATVILRVTLGVVFFAHGAQKVFGWFGGPGLAGAIKYFAGLHVPLVLALCAIAAEFFGSLGLLAGLLTRVAALGILVNMLVAIGMIHIHYGFFMNWHGEQQGEGIEYHLLVIAMAVFLMIRGAGALSMDRQVSGGREASA